MMITLLKNKAKLTLASAREVAFIGLLGAWKEECYLQDFFTAYRAQVKLAPEELQLAQEIAYGTARHFAALHYQGQQLASRHQLSLKQPEKILLYTALYQAIYMDRIPLYAIVNESVTLAKKYCHRQFVSFLNAILRKVADGIPLLSSSANAEAWSIRYSVPEWVVMTWIQTFGLEETESILKIFQKPSPLFARHTHMKTDSFISSFHRLPKGLSLDTWVQNGKEYIQNPTPCLLLEKLSREVKAAPSILDLCCSPGGKLIALHDLFPSAQLVGNDVTETKVNRIRENLSRLGITAELHIGLGEAYPTAQRYDLVILDVPCSNSGVLHKHPEARWRMKEGNIVSLKDLQQKLLAHARKLVATDGELWYLTCSILPQENTQQVDRFCQQFGWMKRVEWTQLPTVEGWDGGYACALKLNTKTEEYQEFLE